MQPNSVPLTPTSFSAPAKKDSAETPDDRKEEIRTPAAASAGAANAAAGKTYVLFEGNILETVLINRLDGQFSGPVECLLSTNVYSNDRQHLLIPAGSKLLGETKRVDSLGQKRLAVAFHRLLMPDGFSVSLDQFKGLNQIGDTGLRDQVNNHYLRIFGVSLAIGVLGAVAEAGTGQRNHGIRHRPHASGTCGKHGPIVRADSGQVPQHSADGHDPRGPSRQSLLVGRSRAARLQQSQNAFRFVKARKDRSPMKKKLLIALLVVGLGVGTASAQLGSGIVYDPTNYHNALLRYYQLQQHLAQLQKSYAKITSQLELATQMARFVQNMPARYRALFSQWRNVTSLNTFGNTGSWISGINSGLLPNINTGYQKSTTQLLPYSPDHLSGMDASQLERVQSQYASVQLVDGANVNAMSTIGSIRGSAQNIQTQIGNLEQDSFSSDSGLNSEVSVLNKINAAGVLTLRTLQDSNKLLASLLEQQTIVAKQQRDATTNSINADISRQASLAGNMSQVTGTITDSLQNFRMP